MYDFKRKLSKLSIFQKLLIVVMIILAIGSFIAMVTIGTRQGFYFNGGLLYPHHDGNSRVYSGKDGNTQSITITVASDEEVLYKRGLDEPDVYTIKYDQSFVPQDNYYTDKMTGAEIFYNGESVFKGGYAYGYGAGLYDVQFDPTDEETVILYTYDNKKYNAKIMAYYIGEFAETKLTVDDVIKLLEGPYLQRKGFIDGIWKWFVGVVICIFAFLLMLFEDDIFQLKMHFYMKEPQYVEASDWVKGARILEWVAFLVAALVFFAFAVTCKY